MPDAIDEILRMNAPLMSNRRVTTGDLEIGGRTIPAGEKITIVNLEAAPEDQPERSVFPTVGFSYLPVTISKR
ncbi:cytochrome P450 [Marinobacter sp. BW6]|uniref:cytochrome P450 n=1 Tax=Marinobacter sp. BW6 TaxID=2592624 RepID=UPI00196883FE|nr:cytochrome P450 [Marinobacter sp. BW6]